MLVSNSSIDYDFGGYPGDPAEERGAVPFTPPPEIPVTQWSPEPEIGTGSRKVNRRPCPRPRQLAGSYG